MKKLYISILIFSLVFSSIFMLTSCAKAKEDPVPEIIEDPIITDPNDPNFDMMKVIDSIYSKSTIEPHTITSVHDLAILTSINYTVENEGPIGVASAELNGSPITVIVLGGTEFVEGQATTIKESQLASTGKDNDYLKAVLKVFSDGNIPKDKPLFVVGISLGGMIAQQLLGKPEITENYDLKYIVTFGSPFTLPTERLDTKIVRFADEKDQVPVLGESLLFTVGVNRNMLKTFNEKELIVRSGKYSKMTDVHALSYVEDDCWNDLDFLGAPYGTNTLITTSKITYFDAPIIVEEASPSI